MILKRLSIAIREQNWVAVILEFIIVIAGVVIGFQVTAWNAERADRVYERDLLNRLHFEIESIQDTRAVYGQRVLPVRDTLEAARPILFGEQPDAELSPVACQMLAASHLVAPAPDSLPSLDELVATGRMQSLREGGMRSAVSEFIQKRETARHEVPAVIASVNNLAERFPDLIQTRLQPHPSQEGQWITYTTCDAEAMAQDLDFLNQASQNIDANTWLAAIHYEYIDVRLERLRTEVESVLGIAHGTDTP